MADISKHNGSNLSGIKAITLIELDGVSTTADGLKIPVPISGDIDATITVASGSQHSIYIMESQATFRTQQQETAAGTQYQSTVVCYTPATRQTATTSLHQLQAKHLLALITDENGNQRLLGNDEERVQLQVNEAQVKDRNGYEITLTMASAEPVPWFSGALS